MKGEVRCVAAWDVHAERIVRPLQNNGSNWSIGDDRTVFLPGHLLACEPRPAPPLGALPHRNEDLPLVALPTVLASLDDAAQFELLLPFASHTIQGVFRRPLIENKYVEDGTDCPSLGSVVARRRNGRFIESSFGQLRFRFRDEDGVSYDLKVTSAQLYWMFDPENPNALFGVDEANEWLEVNRPDGQIILRVGLTRAWAGKNQEWNPSRCYLQLNGIITPDDHYFIFAG